MKLTKKINFILFITIGLISLFLSFKNFNENEMIKFLIGLSIIPAMSLLYILNKNLKYKIPTSLMILYMLFILLTTLFGSLLDFYDAIPFYDKLMHFITGILSSLFGLILLINFNKYDKSNIIFNAIFMLSFTSLIALLWEVFEYISDYIFSGNAQRVLETGINDTMQDMIVSLLGFTVILIIYIYEKKTARKFVISNFIEEVYLNE